MPGRDTFFVGNDKYLKNANYTLALGEDVYCAAYRERLLLGPIEFTDGEAIFSKKAVIIPCNVYYQFVDTVRKAYHSFHTGSEQDWDAIIYKHSRNHHIIGKYDYYNDDAEYGTRFSLCIRWFFKTDKSFNRLVENGYREPIDPEKVTDDYTFLKRGWYMDNNQLSILYSNLATLLEYSYYEVDSKKYVLELVDYVLESEKLCEFLKEKVVDFQTMTYQSKVKILKHLLSVMFEEKKKDDGGEDANYNQKIFLDSLSNKVMLVFSLLNFRMKE